MKTKIARWALHLAVLFVFTGLAFPQQPDSGQPQAVEPMDHTPVFRVVVVSRSTQAVNYRHHDGKTSIDFRGTDLLPQAKGHATVESRTGRLEIETDLEHLPSARTFGSEYLTYVLWAITPEGRPSNLGEVVVRDGKSSMKVTTDLQAFGLIITAEPYFAVTRPSNLVVLENMVRAHTKGWEEPISTRFDAVERGQYTIDIDPSQLPATSADLTTPIDLLEARNAVAIARAEGAERYAPDSFSKAQDFLNRGETYLVEKQNEKAIATVARGAVQSAEDARVLAIRKREEERREAEREAQMERERQARADAEAAQQSEADARSQAERERNAAEQARADAERLRQDADTARAQALAQQQVAQAQVQQAQLTAQQAQLQAQETRERLLARLNEVLETRETARGLIVNMPDVLFETGQYTLKPGARERLAKVGGILLAYPNLHIQIEGHTDNVGGSGYNQQLSEQRANSVRDFLAQQGVRPESIGARGFGMTQPVASNSTAAGRQLNRRVDIVVTGDAIGTNAGVVQQVPLTNSSNLPANSQTPMQPVQTPPAPTDNSPQPPQ